MDFIKKIKEKAKKNPAIIGFPEIEDKRILEAAILMRKEKVAIPVLIGDSKKISVQGVKIIDSSSKELEERLAKKYEEIRKKRAKNVTRKELEEVKKDNIAKAILLLEEGLIDAVLTGATHSTAHTLKWAFKIIGTRKGITKASSYFIMTKKDDVKIFADCAVQENPNAKELAEIAILSNENANKIGMKPNVAMLSYSTKGSADSDSVIKVRKATEIASKEIKSIDGEIQFDAAVDIEVAKEKKANKKLKGKSNVFIFPNLESGNIGYKIMRIYGKYDALGPFLQGTNKPVHDLSRSVSVREIIEISAMVSALR